MHITIIIMRASPPRHARTMKHHIYIIYTMYIIVIITIITMHACITITINITISITRIDHHASLYASIIMTENLYLP